MTPRGWSPSKTGKEKPPQVLWLEGVLFATRPGFEPGPREPKSLVLPLHYRVMDLPSLVATQLDQERQLLQLHGQVHRHHADPGRHTEDRRGEVQQAADAGR